MNQKDTNIAMTQIYRYLYFMTQITFCSYRQIVISTSKASIYKLILKSVILTGKKKRFGAAKPFWSRKTVLEPQL